MRTDAFKETLRGFFFLPREKTAQTHRLFFLDGFRSVALFFMVMSHGLKFWMSPAYADHPVRYWRIFLTKIPAPMFFFLVGTSYILSRDARMRKGASEEQILFSFLRRSGLLFLLAFVYKGIDLLFGVEWKWIRWWEVDVLNIIALSLGLIALLDYARKRCSLSINFFFWLALLTGGLHPLWFPPFLNLHGVLPEVPRLYLQGLQSERAWFTLFPYAGYTLFGAWMVLRLLRGDTQKPMLNLKRVYAGLFALAVIGFLANQIASGSLWKEITYKFYYFGRAYLYLALGVHAAFWFQKKVGFGPFLIIGIHTMIGYWVHAKIVFIYYKEYGERCDLPLSFWLLFKTYIGTFLFLFVYHRIKTVWVARRRIASGSPFLCAGRSVPAKRPDTVPAE